MTCISFISNFITHKECINYILNRILLDSLITSKTRIKLLLKFFLNPGTRAYLRGLAEEFDESTNAVRVELNRLSEAGLLDSENEGRTKIYTVNQNNPLFPEIHTMVKKYLGIDIVEEAVNRLGNVEAAFITGDYAKGRDSGIIDLVVVGHINKTYLDELTGIAEKEIKRKIRVLILKKEELDIYKEKLNIKKSLLIWNKDMRKDNEKG